MKKLAQAPRNDSHLLGNSHVRSEPVPFLHSLGPKFEQYRQLASLRDYLLIAQDRIHVEHFELQSTGSWLLREYKSSTDVVQLASVDCRIPLSDIYQKVTFPAGEQT